MSFAKQIFHSLDQYFPALLPLKAHGLAMCFTTRTPCALPMSLSVLPAQAQKDPIHVPLELNQRSATIKDNAAHVNAYGENMTFCSRLELIGLLVALVSAVRGGTTTPSPSMFTNIIVAVNFITVSIQCSSVNIIIIVGRSL